MMGATSDAPTKVRRGTFRRVLAFARPHRAKLVVFLLLTVVCVGLRA